MMRFLGYAIILASLSVPTFAAKNSQNVTISSPVTVGNTKLPAGQYKVSWKGTGSSLQVTIAAKGLATVTVQAKAVESKNRLNRLTAVLYDTTNGANVLKSITLDNLTLQISGATTGSGE